MNKSYIEGLIKGFKSKVKRYNELEVMSGAPEIIADSKFYRRVTDEKTSLEESILAYNNLNNLLANIELTEKYIDENNSNDDLFTEFLLELKQLEKKAEILAKDFLKARSKLYQGEKDAYISIKKIKGNAEFAELIARQFIAFAECSALKSNYVNENAEMGIIIEKSFELLKTQSGLYLAKGEYDNALVKVTILPKMDNENFEVDKNDLKIETFRSGGAGGQNVNKVESAIRITHLPTEITVICQDERSQLHNKARAIKSINEKVKDFYEKEEKQKYENTKTVILKNAEKKAKEYSFKDKTVFDYNKNITVNLENILNGDIFTFLD